MPTDPTYRERLGRAAQEAHERTHCAKYTGVAPITWEESLLRDQYVAAALAVEAIVRERWVEVAEERANHERERSKACIGLAGKSMYDAAAAAYQDIASSMREGS